jgi:hypothetical protein
LGGVIDWESRLDEIIQKIDLYYRKKSPRIEKRAPKKLEKVTLFQIENKDFIYVGIVVNL